MSISAEYIKEKAYELGFHKVGIAKASQTKKEKKNLDNWLSQKKHGEMIWMEKRKLLYIHQVLWPTVWKLPMNWGTS